MSNKIFFSDLYLGKFLDISVKQFFSCKHERIYLTGNHVSLIQNLKFSEK